MSAAPPVKAHNTPRTILGMKGKEQIVCLTAYTTSMARLLDPHCDLLLVGDSVGMVLYGMESTINVTLDMMIEHGKAVKRGARSACIVVDMPFGSYQESKESAFQNAVRIMQATGCYAVKLEGGTEMAETIAFLTERGVAVCGHVGLMPQQVRTRGYRSVGHSEEEAAKFRADAEAVISAGVFAIVLEGLVEPLARALTAATHVPTIGIGASVACDGQILVTDDMLGLFTDFKPKFVKRYASLSEEIASAVSVYAGDVKARTFPGKEHTFRPRS